MSCDINAEVRGLMEEMKSISDGQNQAELIENMSKGVFTLRDMYKQFQSVMKLGPMDKIMGMIPGMPQYLIPENGSGDNSESTLRLRKFMYMMDSMNNAEVSTINLCQFALSINMVKSTEQKRTPQQTPVPEQ